MDALEYYSFNHQNYTNWCFLKEDLPKIQKYINVFLTNEMKTYYQTYSCVCCRSRKSGSSFGCHCCHCCYPGSSDYKCDKTFSSDNPFDNFLTYYDEQYHLRDYESPVIMNIEHTRFIKNTYNYNFYDKEETLVWSLDEDYKGTIEIEMN